MRILAIAPDGGRWTGGIYPEVYPEDVDAELKWTDALFVICSDGWEESEAVGYAMASAHAMGCDIYLVERCPAEMFELREEWKEWGKG